MDDSRIITFRLDPYHLQLLMEQSGKKPRNLRARELLIRALHETNLAAVVERRLVETSGLVSALRNDLSVTVQAAIVLSGRATKEKAKEWADKHFRP